MVNYTDEERSEALQVVSSSISKCEKMQPKFAEGTSQHTLLRNRIKALYISKTLITQDSVLDSYTKQELIDALPPVSSIISKCEKAQLKYVEGTTHYKRFQKMINAMYIAKAFIMDEVGRRQC